MDSARLALTLSRANLSFTPLPSITNRSTLSPEHFHESLRLTSAENLWRCMHADDSRSTELPDHFIRPKVATANTLSELTQRANHTLEGMQKSDDAPRMSSYSDFWHSPRGKLPSEVDFKRAIEKLTRVYTHGGIETLKIKLQEGKTAEIMLEPDTKLYAKLQIQGELCPLIISITRIRGRLVTFLSKTVQEPNEITADAKITGDRIWLSDPGMRFRSNLLYICFQATEETVFTLNTQFGQKKKNAKETGKNNRFSAFDEDWEKVFGAKLEKKPKYEKDFIQKNLTIKRVNSPEIRLQSLEKTSLIETRRHQALIRKKSRLDFQRKKALETVNRQEIRLKAREKQELLDKEKAGIALSVQKWMTAMWVLKVSQEWSVLYDDRKVKIEEGTKRLGAIVKIILAYRRYVRRSDAPQLALRRAGFSLSLGVHHFGLIDRQIIKANVGKVIKESWKLARLPGLVKVFVRKGKG